MDTLLIQQLSVAATIGVHQWEKAIKQTLLISLELHTDAKAAAKDDSLQHTKDYAAIATNIEQFVAEHPVELLETLAERLSQHLQHTFAIDWLKLTIEKPGAIPAAKNVALTIERKKSDD